MMRSSNPRYWALVALLPLGLGFLWSALSATQQIALIPDPTPIATSQPIRPSTTMRPRNPAFTSTPTALPTPRGTTIPTAEPLPTARPAGAAPRVGLQVGHWKSEELPEELARLRTSSGAFFGDYSESKINLDIAQRTAALLTARGLIVDILPATIPVDYDADAFIAIHADGSNSRGARGFKIATPWRTSRAAQHLLETLTAEYSAMTGLPWENSITFNMRGYYAFNYRRHDHAVKKTTPAVIVEMGFLTSATDRALMIERPDLIAHGIANGIMRYLNERNLSDVAALLPPEYKTQRPLSADGIAVRSEPSDQASLLVHATADRRFNPLLERDGWFQVIIRDGNRRLLGWVRKDLLRDSDDPTPTPLPSTDS